jgi:hypothetical protein
MQRHESQTFWPPPMPFHVKRRPPSRRRRQDCIDCGIDTSFATGNGHYYTVHSDVWLSVMPDPRGGLCLDCLQARLGRPLADADFVATPFEIFRRLFLSSPHSPEELDELMAEQVRSGALDRVCG